MPIWWAYCVRTNTGWLRKNVCAGIQRIQIRNWNRKRKRLEISYIPRNAQHSHSNTLIHHKRCGSSDICWGQLPDLIIRWAITHIGPILIHLTFWFSQVLHVHFRWSLVISVIDDNASFFLLFLFLSFFFMSLGQNPLFCQCVISLEDFFFVLHFFFFGLNRRGFVSLCISELPEFTFQLCQVTACG